MTSSAADKLRDLHAESQVDAGWDSGPYDLSEDHVGRVLLGALPDIIAVIAAAEHIVASNTTGVPVQEWVSAHEEVARALAALNARLTNTSDGDGGAA